MEYKLLNDGQGVILTRQVCAVNGDLSVKFNGAPYGAVALLSSEEGKCLRTLYRGECLVPQRIISGTVEVSVVAYDGTVNPKSWKCESLSATRLENGELLIAPEDGNLSLEVANLKLSNHSLREDLSALEKKFDKLSEKFTSMMEGYDLI